ncbi:hypothetical protein D9615_002501 [Tricholomella constricta]|uniref:Uncharacterized protein n=1 Tax=Tricholomella constricta TaxID=117010 RepID=A0A8H5HMU5_9AGAR|nr:hypothetical protein D9615_002501 [Tricholomella constricta]
MGSEISIAPHSIISLASSNSHQSLLFGICDGLRYVVAALVWSLSDDFERMVSPPSPQKRRHDIMSGHPPSPLSMKRHRASTTTSSGNLGPSTNASANASTGGTLYSFLSTDEESMDKGSIVTISDSTMLGSSLDAMGIETHQNRLSIREKMTSDTATGDLYARHLKNYLEFMEGDQARRIQQNPLWTPVPAHPITATKAAAFLQHETTRNKRTRDGKDIPGTRLGPDHIKQCVNALESYRYHHKGSDPRYKDIPEAQVTLRDDERITTYEKSAYATESERVAESQVLKAKGVTSDTFKDDELIRCSMWLLRSSRKTVNQIHLALRDRAMLLISTSTAYRGDNLRRLQLSDISFRNIPMVDVGLDVQVMATIFRSNKGKTNDTGRIDDQGAFRHRIPELCAIGALGFHLFGHYHLINASPPNFVPDFARPGAGEFGYRDWYTKLLFPGSNGNEMTYENHNRRVNIIKKQNNIEISKVTHTGRSFFVLYTRERGSAKEDTRHGGGWTATSSYDKSYDRVLPVAAMLAASGFNGKKQDSYFVARGQLEPPDDLCSTLFPWAESELAALDERIRILGNVATDVTLRSFLNFLQILRRIILQDAAVLFVKFPDCPLWRQAPFNRTEFREFAGTASVIIHRAEEEARHRLKDLPESVAASFRGMVMTSKMHQEQTREEIHDDNARLSEKLQNIEECLGVILETCKGPKQRKRKQNGDAATTPLPLVQISHEARETPSTTVPPPPHSSEPSLSQLYPALAFPMSQDLPTRGAQLAYIATLEAKFSRDRLSKHQFDWIISSRRNQADEFLPRYSFWTPEGQNAYPTVRQIWTEYKFGMDGCLSISELNAGWDARWRSQGPARTEMSRRNKIIGLVEDLSKNPNWRPELALQYLETKYPIPTRSVPYLRTTRAFIDCLQKQDKKLRVEILEGSKAFYS